MSRTRQFLTSIAIVIMVGGLACSNSNTSESEQIQSVLEKAGDNRPELEKVIAHYEEVGDQQKLDAALYLIGNMEEHCYVTYRMFDTSGVDVDFNVLDYPDYDSLISYINSVEKERGELDYERKEKILDIETIKADYLIGMIDNAFLAWQEKPWAKNYSFDVFLKYILPYRGSNEPLDEWRTYFLDLYKDLPAKMKSPEDPIEAAALINDDLKSWFKFDARYYLHPTDQGLPEMMDTKMGRCEDITNLTIYALRANGLPITSDYTPYWANTGNNHAWNAIVQPDGKVIPFMGAEANPGEYKLYHQAAKVYRKSFGLNPENLIFQERKQEAIPGWLRGKTYLDVTEDYVDTTSVTYTFESAIPDSVDIAYLCVFNSGAWKPIDWARIENGSATFKKIGCGIACLIGLYINEEIEPYSDPILLGDDGALTFLTADTNSTRDIQLVSTTKRTQIKSAENIAETSLKQDTKYKLSYYDHGWVTLDEKVSTDKPLEFDAVPANCLFWLVADESDKEERIFTIDKEGQQNWW